MAGPPTTGGRLPILGRCDSTITWNSHTPFYVAHGFAQPSWGDPTVTTPTIRRGFMAPTTHFSLWIDGGPVSLGQYREYLAPTDTMNKWFYRNFPTGMTGTHVFLGQWWQDASLTGGTFGTSELALECKLQVDFV